MTITEPGVYLNLDETEYHAHPALSQSRAKLLIPPSTPAHFRWAATHPQPPKKVYDLGTAAHSLVLGVGKQPIEIPADLLAVNGAASTKDAKAFMDAARADGKVPLKPAEYAQVLAMADELATHDEAMSVLNPAGREVLREVSMFRRDESTGVMLRCRLDSIAPKHIAGDYKTTPDADPYKFGRTTAADLGYYLQAAWYLDTAISLDLADNWTPFKFVLQQKTEPYLVSVVELSTYYLTIGRTVMRAAIDLYAECATANRWPGYEGTTIVDPPRWLEDLADMHVTVGISDELEALRERTA